MHWNMEWWIALGPQFEIAVVLWYCGRCLVNGCSHVLTEVLIIEDIFLLCDSFDSKFSGTFGP
jgi:hypothetical protein